MPFSCGTVQCKSSREGSVVLDIEHDRILKLNAVGKDIWALLSKGWSEEAISVELSRKYQVDADRVRNDVSGFVSRIKQLGLTVDSETSSVAETQTVHHSHHPWYGRGGNTESHTPGGFVTFLSLVGLFLFDLILSLFSFKILCRSVKAWPVRTRAGADHEIGEVCAAVQGACVWYPRKALCLQRSAVTTCLLRSKGIPARMVFGVREMPFLAHAWVEVNGSVVNDWPKVQSFYKSTAAF